jgi:hypothetical protein
MVTSYVCEWEWENALDYKKIKSIIPIDFITINGIIIIKQFKMIGILSIIFMLVFELQNYVDQYVETEFFIE